MMIKSLFESIQYLSTDFVITKPVLFLTDSSTTNLIFFKIYSSKQHNLSSSTHITNHLIFLVWIIKTFTIFSFPFIDYSHNFIRRQLAVTLQELLEKINAESKYFQYLCQISWTNFNVEPPSQSKASIVGWNLLSIPILLILKLRSTSTCLLMVSMY